MIQPPIDGQRRQFGQNRRCGRVIFGTWHGGCCRERLPGDDIGQKVSRFGHIVKLLQARPLGRDRSHLAPRRLQEMGENGQPLGGTKGADAHHR